MLSRARRDAQAVAGGLRAAVTWPGPPGLGENGHRRRDCQAEGTNRHWRKRRGRLLDDGRLLAEPEGRTARGKRMAGGSLRRDDREAKRVFSTSGGITGGRIGSENA